MQKAKVGSRIPTAWNTVGKLHLTLAARHDAGFNCVTVNVRDMIREGLIPMTFEGFCKNFSQGDVFLLQLNGQVNVMAKVNRANKTTMAFHCPRIVQMPVWNVDSSSVVEVNAVMLGYTGIQLNKLQTSCAIRAEDLTGTHPLDARLDTPAEHPTVLRNVKSIRIVSDSGFTIFISSY